MKHRAGGARTRFLVLACGAALLLAVPVVATAGPGPGRSAMIGALAAAPRDDAPPAAVPGPVAPGSVAPGPGASAPGPFDVPGPELMALPPPPTDQARAGVDAAEDAATPATELAVAVLDRRAGEVVGGERGTEPFFTASLSKVVVAVDMLDRRRLDGLAVTEADIELIRRALGPSDDNAMNALWTGFDGVGAAERLSRRLGLTGTTAPADPSQWGEMAVPATDTVRIWQHILDEMPAADRDLLVSAMAVAPARARDGFDQAFGLLSTAVDGPGGPGAVAKQGWLCCFAGRYYLHSTGAVGAEQRFLVAVLTRVPRDQGWEAARQEVSRIAAAAVQALG